MVLRCSWIARLVIFDVGLLMFVFFVRFGHRFTHGLPTSTYLEHLCNIILLESRRPDFRIGIANIYLTCCWF